MASSTLPTLLFELEHSGANIVAGVRITDNAVLSPQTDSARD